MVRYYFKSLHVKTGEKVSDVKLSIAEEVRVPLYCTFSRLFIVAVVLVMSDTVI